MLDMLLYLALTYPRLVDTLTSPRNVFKVPELYGWSQDTLIRCILCMNYDDRQKITITGCDPEVSFQTNTCLCTDGNMCNNMSIPAPFSEYHTDGLLNDIEFDELHLYRSFLPHSPQSIIVQQYSLWSKFISQLETASDEGNKYGYLPGELQRQIEAEEERRKRKRKSLEEVKTPPRVETPEIAEIEDEEEEGSSGERTPSSLSSQSRASLESLDEPIPPPPPPRNVRQPKLVFIPPPDGAFLDDDLPTPRKLGPTSNSFFFGYLIRSTSIFFMNHRIDPVFHHGHMDDSEMLMDEQDYMQYPEEDEMTEDGVGDVSIRSTRGIHQCNVCSKVFVSYKGLQQHAVIHTDQKPFTCDVCNKSFRFKSNLFEHRSVHTGYTPHACPYCGKTCRLKGNLKKHLRTHVTTKEELEAAWRPFASNRRPSEYPATPQGVMIRSENGEDEIYVPKRPVHRKKKALGLGDVNNWTDKVRTGELVPSSILHDKLRKFENQIYGTLNSIHHLRMSGRSIAFERFDCPICCLAFDSRYDCLEHLNMEHPGSCHQLSEMYCEKCIRRFTDQDSYAQHLSYHAKLDSIMKESNMSLCNHGILVPSPEDMAIILGPPELDLHMHMPEDPDSLYTDHKYMSFL
ncbi:unnamed protein product [Caenorhabditis auriculariae]|uniref:C2H2-type domain-containing protein n=1 Tax=Caenorhabditis auriculariae TaxID=2777116 RepID=A0A8S1GVC9_9PELO|nr:unnamed protein product [Caenorhabditis auriculariae]